MMQKEQHRVYKVPENYFQELSQKIEEKRKKRAQQKRKETFFYISSAAAAILLIVSLGNHFMSTTNDTLETNFTETDLEWYIEDYEINSEELASINWDEFHMSEDSISTEEIFDYFENTNYSDVEYAYYQTLN